MKKTNQTVPVANVTLPTNRPVLAKPLNETLLLFVNSQDISTNSQSVYKRTFRQFLFWTQNTERPFDGLKGSDIVEYKHYLSESGLSTASQNAYLLPVRRFYEWAEREKLYPNIAKGIKGNKKERTIGHKPLNDEEVSSLFENFRSFDYRRKDPRTKTKTFRNELSPELRSRNYAIANLMLRTGLRTIEVVRLDVCDFEEAEELPNGNHVLKIWGKGRKSKDQIVVITEKAYSPIREYLTEFRKGRKLNEPLFTSASNQNDGERLTTRTVSKVCKEGLLSVGKDSRKYTAHSFRTTTACALLEHGCNVFQAQAVLRHANPSTTQIYTKIKEDELRLREAPESVLDFAF